MVVYPAGSQTYPFKTYADKGFNANQIFALYQDKTGYIWIGTGVGVVRYDAREFRTFSVENGLPANEVLVLTPGDSNTIWIGTALGLASMKWDYNQNQPVMSTQSFFKRFSISALWHTPRGLWVGTRRNGLYFLPHSDSINITTLREKVSVKEIKADVQGNIWVLDDTGLSQFDPKGKHIAHYTLKIKGRLKTFLFTPQQIWLGASSGLYKLQRHPDGRLFPAKRLLKADINRLTLHHASLWIAADKGLYRLNNGSLQGWNRTNGMPGVDIRAMLFDQEDNLWLGSYNRGLFSFNNRRIYSYTEKDGLASPVVNGIAYDPAIRGRLLATDKGIYRIVNGRLSRDPRFRALDDEIIWFIYPDREGRLWFGGEDILARYDKGELKRIRLQSLQVESTFIDMAEDHEGIYWFATTVGLFSLNKKEDKTYPEIAGHNIRSVWDITPLKDKKELLIGTDNGLVRYKNGAFQFIQQQDGLPDRAIYTITRDTQGIIWLGADRGIIKMNGDQFRLYGRSNGLNGTIIAQILPDPKRGGIWICSDEGLQYFRNGKAGLSVTKTDGLVGNEFTTQNASMLDTSGRLWLGLFGGLTVLESDWVFRPMPQPKIIIHKASRLTGRSRTAEPLKRGDSFTRLHPGILFDVQGLYYYNPEALILEYRLNNLDNNWIELPPGSRIRYNSLAPGAYTLQLRARVGETVFHFPQLDFPFTVRQPFWLSWWFIFIMIVLVTLPFIWYFRYKAHQIAAVNRALQEKISQSTRELELTGALLANIVEHSGHMLITVDMKGRIITWNKRAEEVFNYPKSHILHKSIDVLDSPEDAWPFEKIIRKAAQNDVIRMLELRKKSSDGRIVELVASATALKDKKGNVSLINLNMEDFSEHNRDLEDRINRERLLAGIEALNRLLATLSHYINNAIASISGMAQLVSMDKKYQDKFNEITRFQIKRIQAVLVSLSDLVRSLNIKTRDYVGEKGTLFDIEQQINRFIESVQNNPSRQMSFLDKKEATDDDQD